MNPSSLESSPPIWPGLKGKRALILGVANERSLAWSIARHLAASGVETAFTYQGDSLERRVRPLAESIGSKLVLPCDVSKSEQLQDVFRVLEKEWGQLDIVIHSVAFAQKQDLEGRTLDTQKSSFLQCMEISVYSLIETVRLAEKMLREQGTVLTLSYLGSQRIVPNYNLMGIAKAALEATVRYLSLDLGSKKVTMNSLSAGPVKTLAAAGIKDFRKMLQSAALACPLGENISAEDVGAYAAFLCGPGGRHITGTNVMIDSGAHVMGPLTPEEK